MRLMGSARKARADTTLRRIMSFPKAIEACSVEVGDQEDPGIGLAHPGILGILGTPIWGEGCLGGGAPRPLNYFNYTI